MKKKIYIAPDMMEVKINTESHLLDASQVEFGSEYSSGGSHRSRGGDSFWDDEDE